MVEEPLQGEMSRRAPSLIHGSRFAETVDGPELEELGARLEVPGTARGEGLQWGQFQFYGHDAECKTGL
jgi:hypothetical protein